MEVRRRTTYNDEKHDSDTFVEKIRKADTFEKLPQECVNYTSSGGGASIITFLVIFMLIIAELNQFANPEVNFQYSVDDLIEGELPINIDMTVAMKCSEVSIDVVDLNGNALGSTSQLRVINSKFELAPERKKRFNARRMQMNFLREQHHSLYQYFWISQTDNEEFDLQPIHHYREDEVAESKADACRFVGTFMARKSPGNLHVTTGKPLELNSNMHIHIAPLSSNGVRNFSHRIHHLSFGSPLPNFIHPLDAEEIISDDPALMYQYFIEVIPTTFRTSLTETKTYQYAVTEQARSISKNNQGQGVPGVFFRYDTFPVRVEVEALAGGGGSGSIVRLLLRLSAIVGGVFATGNLICLLLRATIAFGWSLRDGLGPRSATPGLEASAPLIPEFEGL
nr:endoplasmic reticulum Golgi intermediate [Hymenolepis microstoma]